MKSLEPLLLNPGKVAFRDQVADLKVIHSIDKDDEPSEIRVSQSILRICGLARDAEPENIDGHSFLDQAQITCLTGDCVTSVAPDCERSWNLHFTVGRLCADSRDRPVFLQQT